MCELAVEPGMNIASRHLRYRRTCGNDSNSCCCDDVVPVTKRVNRIKELGHRRCNSPDLMRARARAHQSCREKFIRPGVKVNVLFNAAYNVAQEAVDRKCFSEVQNLPPGRVVPAITTVYLYTRAHLKRRNTTKCDSSAPPARSLLTRLYLGKERFRLSWLQS